MIVVFFPDAEGKRRYGVHKFFWGGASDCLMIGEQGSYSRQLLGSVRAVMELRGWSKKSIQRLIDAAHAKPVTPDQI